MTVVPHPGAVLAAIADERRLRVLAAVVLGASDEGAVAERAGLPAGVVTAAVRRLEDLGVVTDGPGGLSVDRAALLAVAQSASRLQRSTDPEDLGASPEQAAVLRGYLADGRLTHLPAQRSKRLVVLSWIAERFEPGRTYPEPELRFELQKLFRDDATLRRALVDDGLLERRSGLYWRSGSLPDPPA